MIHQSIPEATSKTKAEAAERKLIDRAFNKRYGFSNHDVRFADFADTTYRKYVRQKNANTVAKEIDIEYMIEFFGKRKLIAEITPQDCRDVQDWLLHKPTYEKDEKRTSRPRSPSSVNRSMSTLSKIFTLACEEGELDKNPMEFVGRLDEPPPRHRLLTQEQKEAFWREVSKDPFMFRIVMLGVNLPVRRGQILAMTKEAVNIENRTLSIVASKGRAPRMIPLNNAAAQILAEMCSEVESGPLITFKGKKIGSFKTRWNKLLVRTGINKENGTREENFHFHDLRTEFGTNLLKNNVNPEVINQLYSHSSMQITKVYLGEDMTLLRSAVNSLDENIQNTETVQ